MIGTNDGMSFMWRKYATYKCFILYSIKDICIYICGKINGVHLELYL